jgi:4,5-dihydroxyphthalate decarboxylase
MADLSLTFAVGSPNRLQPVLDGTVRPEGIELQCSVTIAGDLFWLMPRSEPFDVSEMSLTGYLWGIQHGKRWVALPVFPGWVFGCHADTLVNAHAGITSAADLRGKRVGVPEYPVTAIAYIRDAWEREAGVGREEIHWFEERTKDSSHYRPLGYRPPERVPVEIIPEDKCLADMLLAGELDAVTRYFGGPRQRAPGALPGDRSPQTMQQLAEHPDVRWLYPDRKAAALAYGRQVGMPQPIHCIIIKQDVVDRHPWVPRSLYAAFAEAARRTTAAATVHTSFPFPAAEQQQTFGADFLPVGLDARNRALLEQLLAQAALDGFLVGDYRPTVDELFPASLLDG